MFARLIKISLLFTMQNHITMFLATQSYIFVKYCRMVKKTSFNIARNYFLLSGPMVDFLLSSATGIEKPNQIKIHAIDFLFPC